MTNRILLNDSGLKISKPGYDVTTAGNGDLSFSSDWSQLAVFDSGMFTLDRFAKNDLVATWSRATPPIVMFWDTDSLGISYGQFFAIGCMVFQDPGGAGSMRIGSITSETGGLRRRYSITIPGSSHHTCYFKWIALDYGVN